MATGKRQTAIRFRPETEKLLEMLEKDTGLTKTGVIELAVRDLAKARQISIPEQDGQTATIGEPT